MSSGVLSEALGYASRGVRVFPVYEINPEGNCACGVRGKSGDHKPGKHPRTPHGHLDATCDEAQIALWWRQWPNANIGRALGERDLVVDVDPRNDGDRSLVELERRYEPLPATQRVRTGGGGDHYYFKLSAGLRVRCGSLGPGIDLKSAGGYVLLPPSNHESGRTYEWAADGHPNDVPVAEAPRRLLDLIARDRPRLGNGEQARIHAGERNVKLASVAGGLRRQGAGVAPIEALLRAFNREQCDPPLPESEVRHVARSIGRYPPSDERLSGSPPSNGPDAEVEEPNESTPEDEQPHEDEEIPPASRSNEGEPDGVDAIREAFANRPRFETFLSTEPPPREWVVKDLIPLATGGMLIGEGGGGKGFVEMMLMICVAAGWHFGPCETTRGRVVMIAREDDRDELHRRGRASVRAIDPQLGDGQGWRHWLDENVTVVPIVGPPVSLDEAVIEAIADEVNAIGGVILIILDPLCRLLPLDVELNKQEGAARIHRAVDLLVSLTGAAVLVAHHVSKAGRLDKPGDDRGAGSSSGSHVLEDLSRFVLRLVPASESDKVEYGLERRGSYVKLKAPKENYSPALEHPLIFRRMEGGALAYVRQKSLDEVRAERSLEALRGACESAGHSVEAEVWDKACHALSPRIARDPAQDARKTLLTDGRVVTEPGQKTARQKGPAKLRFRPADWAPSRGKEPLTDPDAIDPGKNPGGFQHGEKPYKSSTFSSALLSRTGNQHEHSAGEDKSSINTGTYANSETVPTVPPYGRGKPPGRFPSRGGLGADNPTDATLEPGPNPRAKP